MQAQRTDAKKSGLETPGTLVIMAVYLALFFVMWLLGFVYLAARWAVG